MSLRARRYAKRGNTKRTIQNSDGKPQVWGRKSFWRLFFLKIQIKPESHPPRNKVSKKTFANNFVSGVQTIAPTSHDDHPFLNPSCASHVIFPFFSLFSLYSSPFCAPPYPQMLPPPSPSLCPSPHTSVGTPHRLSSQPLPLCTTSSRRRHHPSACQSCP